LTWLGKKWEDVYKELTIRNIDFLCDTTYPAGKAAPCGDLRIARVSRVGGKLKFILLHDRFNR